MIKGSFSKGHIGHRCVVGGAALTLSLALAACGSSSSKASSSVAPTTSAPASAAPSTAPTAPNSSTSAATMVDVKNFMFTPMAVTVAVGSTVTWKFEDSVAHTVKADDGSFSSPPMSGGQTFSHTFATAGTFKYICSIHPNMMASITVR